MVKISIVCGCNKCLKNIRYLYVACSTRIAKWMHHVGLSIQGFASFAHTHISISLIVYFLLRFLHFVVQLSDLLLLLLLTVDCWLLTSFGICGISFWQYELSRQEKATFTFGAILNCNFVGRVVYEYAQSYYPLWNCVRKNSPRHNSPMQWNRNNNEKIQRH